MIRKYGLPLLALAGFSFSIFMIYWSHRTPPAPPILFEPAHSPYSYYVAGEGTIESFDENVQIGTSYPDLIWDVYVKAGDKVTRGTPLFRLDTRQQEANLQTAIAELSVAKTEYQDRKTDFDYYQKLKDKSAVSAQAYTQAYFAKQRAKNRIQVAIAEINRLKMIIERALIFAPTDGQVLQANARVGEFANVNPFDRIPLMIFGKTDIYQVRVNIAEEDAWRVQKGAQATAFVRGNASIQIPLQFSYIEPYIAPKQVLTGSDVERVDTRVLQIVYTFSPQELPVYIGQLLDVYVEAKPSKV